MRHGLWIGTLALLLCLWAEPVSAQTSGSGPEAVTVSFYKWYLHALAQEQVPTDQLNGPMKAYISSRLSSELRKMLRSGDMEVDYFLKAQDFLPDWESHVAITPAKSLGVIHASTSVTLGATPETAHHLRVELTREAGKWKISAVRALQ